ncbi:MAG: hypothetical protein LBD52_01915, partial [Prevotellaceae bacterium]|nr:hypothetical protein [Prevotellaceae bacterium]
ALYFYLVEVCNICRWKNPFKRNNAKIEADLSISFNTLKNARNKLQQCDLISFKTTNGSANVIYTLSKFDKVTYKVCDKVGDEVSIVVGDEVLSSKDKRKINKTKFPPIVPPQGGDGGAPPSDKFLNFKKWISENAPRVEQLKQPFTEREYTEIFAKWKREDVLNVLVEMHNYKPLMKKNISAYLTANNWLKRRENDEKTNEKPKAPYITD